MNFNLKNESSYGLKNTIKGMEYFYDKFNQKYEQLVTMKGMNTKILDEKLNELNFLFGAFLNQYQTLRDLLSRLGCKDITWEILNDQKQERIFFKDIRNIYVHQGSLLIHTFCDNELYIAGPIYNIKRNGEIEELTPLDQPVKKLVKTFFKGIISYLLNQVENKIIEVEFEINNNEFENQIEKNIKIPQFAKELSKEFDLNEDFNNHKYINKNFIDYLKKIENQLIQK